MRSEALKKAQRKYNESPEGKAAFAKYAVSPKGKARLKKYRATPKGKIARQRATDKQQTGMSSEQISVMRQTQNNLCGVCQRPFEKTPHVDHDHETGKIRGLLCQHCNTAEGMIRATGLSAYKFGIALTNYLKRSKVLS